MTAFKMILGISSYKIIFGMACHLPVKLEHRALWVTKQLNFDLDQANDHRKLQNFELEELKNEAYENTKITKSRVKVLHGKFILRKTFVPR